MLERYIQSFHSCFLDPGDEKASLAALAPGLPRRAARRMSRLGILLHVVLEKEPLDLQTSLVYGTTYAEGNALESYLDSLPHASPTAFQTSIHPGGIEQALILRKQEVGAFFPHAGEEALLPQLLKSAMVAATPEVVLCGGEESGGWLMDFHLASAVSFAFAMRLSRQADSAIGRVTWSPGESHSGPLPSLQACIRKLEKDKRIRFGSETHGCFEISITG